MTQGPTLALLIPAYNAAATLPRLLDSAIRQTDRFDEIWVYDDCSSDDTAAMAERYGARVVTGEINRGCSHGKNVLAVHTRCDWLHFHDADDELLPDFVSLARRWMAGAHYDVVLFPYEERDDSTGAHVGVRRFDPADLAGDARSYVIREQVNPFCGLYRRSAFLRAGGYDEDPAVLYNEDVAAHVRFAFAGLRFAADTEVAIINHRRMNSMSASNRRKCFRAHYEVMRKLSEHPDAGPYASEIAERLWYAAGLLASELDFETADASAALALELGGPPLLRSGAMFKMLCQVSPRAALRLRELAIRVVKPQFREGYPGWRAALPG